MSKIFPLQPLVHLTQLMNDAATKKLGQLNQQEHSAQSKLDTLEHYRKDYQARFEDAEKLGMDHTDLRNFQDFLDKLDSAIAQQLSVIEKAKNSVQHGRDDLMSTTRKMKSFDTLAQRHIETEKLFESRSEQREQDEQSGRFSAYKITKKNEEK
jgi:flagellar FliJ protein